MWPGIDEHDLENSCLGLSLRFIESLEHAHRFTSGCENIPHTLAQGIRIADMPLVVGILTINISTALIRIADLDTHTFYNTLPGYYIMVFSLHMVVVLVAMLVVASSALSSNPDDEWPLGEERIEPVICYGKLHFSAFIS